MVIELSWSAGGIASSAGACADVALAVACRSGAPEKTLLIRLPRDVPALWCGSPVDSEAGMAGGRCELGGCATVDSTEAADCGASLGVGGGVAFSCWAGAIVVCAEWLAGGMATEDGIAVFDGGKVGAPLSLVGVLSAPETVCSVE